MNLFDEITRITNLHGYAVTGDEAFLKDIKPMGFSDPVHLPQPLPQADPLVFDEWNDELMRDCIGGRLTKPVQELLQAFTTMKEGDYLYDELKALREAVKEEFRDL